MAHVGDMQDLIEFFGEYNDFLERTVLAQNEKIEALLTHDVDIMEQSVAQQQAISMQMSNYEERRQKLQQQAGCKDYPFSRLIQVAEGKEKQLLQDAYTRMQDHISQIKYLNDKAMELVETNLKLIDMEIPVQDRQEPQGYTVKGKQQSLQKGSPLFETKI